MTIKEYQQDCFKNYKSEIGYPPYYTYFYGNPLQVLVPIETAVDQFMVVGAYPSAKFYTVNGILDVPLCDNDAPFSSESYFDGSRVRTIPSGEELNQVILKEIGIERRECWITDLVKVFLFKEGHINRYKEYFEKVGESDKTEMVENRSKFDCYATRSLSWLYREIAIANPKLIILLGIEVVKTVFGISEGTAKDYLDGQEKIKAVDDVDRRFVCLPHPGILMKKFDRNPWPARFETEIAPAVREIISKIRNQSNETGAL